MIPYKTLNQDQPNGEDDYRAEQEIAEGLLDRLEAQIVDALDKPLDALDDLVWAEPERRKHHAHD